MDSNNVLTGIVSEEELAAELRRTPRTLKRWRDLCLGPPVIMVGRRPMYSIEAVRGWLSAGGTSGSAGRLRRRRRRGAASREIGTRRKEGGERGP